LNEILKEIAPNEEIEFIIKEGSLLTSFFIQVGTQVAINLISAYLIPSTTTQITNNYCFCEAFNKPNFTSLKMNEQQF
jgi:hypothetical protein